MCKLYLTVELITYALLKKRENDSRCVQQSAEALERRVEIQFKCEYHRCILTRCKCNPTKSEQRHKPDMRHTAVPVGEWARAGEGVDIQGSYPSFCYSAADLCAALVGELAVTSVLREGTGERGEACEEKEELHLVVAKIQNEVERVGGDHTLLSSNGHATNT